MSAWREVNKGWVKQRYKRSILSVLQSLIYIYVSMEGACESRCVHEDRKESSETDSDLAKR